MSTNFVSGYTPASITTQNTATTNKNSSNVGSADSNLSKNEFLKILASQLANQDPLSPMQDTDFIAQMAQFSSLEQMQNLNATFSSYQAYSLIGKEVLATVSEADGTQQQIYGTVAGVSRQDNTDYLEVGSYRIPISSVISVYDANSMDGTITQAASLIGKNIQADVPSPDGSENTTSISGKVESIIVKNGLLYAKVEDTEVPVAYIKTIS